ncbi:MAG: hypothetical protein JWO79_4612 [Actinomycetia bacterium]|jgi:hypothetical protein|nr:hypothetical protein [Actinomycetes bacterium]MDQ1658653.1 hypothetical protein [Cryptosporangiaceae bacterium]
MSWSSDPRKLAVARWRGIVAVLVLFLAVFTALGWSAPSPQSGQATAAPPRAATAAAPARAAAQDDPLHESLWQTTVFWDYLRFTAGSVALGAMVLWFFWTYRTTYDEN